MARPKPESLGWQFTEFCLNYVSLYTMIKNLEEDFGFMLEIIVQDIIKLFQKLLTVWKNGPNLTKGNIN